MLVSPLHQIKAIKVACTVAHQKPSNQTPHEESTAGNAAKKLCVDAFFAVLLDDYVIKSGLKLLV